MGTPIPFLFFSFILSLSASWCISQYNLFRLPHLSPEADMKMQIHLHQGPRHIVTSAIWRHHVGGPPPGYCAVRRSLGTSEWEREEGKGKLTTHPYYWNTGGSTEFLFISSICQSSSSYILLTLCLDVKGNKWRVIISRLLQGHVADNAAAIKIVVVKLKTCLWPSPRAKSVPTHNLLINSP